MSDKTPVDRRGFLKVVGATGAAAGAAVAPLAPAMAQAPSAAPAHAHAALPAAANKPHDSLSGWTFFNVDEASAMRAVIDTLIPADATGPGAVEAGCLTYMDRQLAGAYGRGARLYMQGPFQEGTPQQGYQLPLAPADLVKIGLADLEEYAQASRKQHFRDLTPADRAAVLTEVDGGKASFAHVPPATWFNQVLNLVMEGYFGDPIYGGNKDKAAWKMIGFPGVPAMYADLMEEYRNKPYPVPPRGIQDLA